MRERQRARATGAGAERPPAERALADGARGLLIAPRRRSHAVEEADHGWLAGLGVPTVLMERRPRPGSAAHALDSVCSDHWCGARPAVEHLVSLGHTRLVLAARDDSPTARALRAAFAQIAAVHPGVERWEVALSSPPLTAVAPPKAAVGRAAAELLLHRLASPPGAAADPVRRVELLPELTVRGSTQAPGGAGREV